MIGNASVASFDEGVLTLRFPRQGDVKGFQGSKYEDLLKQAITAMFGINVVIRAVTGGGDAPSPRPPPGQARRRRRAPPSGGQPPAAGPVGTGPAPGRRAGPDDPPAGSRRGTRGRAGVRPGVPCGTGRAGAGPGRPRAGR